MASQQRERHAMPLPVTQKYAELEPERFRDVIAETVKASQAILDCVSEQVERNLISPVHGAQVAAAVTGTMFGFQEFHRELSPADLALLNWQTNGGDGR